MENNKNDGCTIAFGLLIGLIVIDYLFIIGFMWFVCWCFGPLGFTFDIRLATGAWLILHLIWYFYGKIKKNIRKNRNNL